MKNDDRCRQIQETAEAFAAVSPYSVDDVVIALEVAANAAANPAICNHDREYRTLNGEVVCYWCGELGEEA